MVRKCDHCGGTNFRDSLGGEICTSCNSKVDSTSVGVSSEVNQNDAYPSVNDGFVEAGDFQVESSKIDKALDAHEDRSEKSQKRDEERRARVTTDFDQWKNDKDSFDFPGVDTPKNRPEAKEKDKPFVDDDGFLSDIF